MDPLSKINDAMEIKGLWKELLSAVMKFFNSLFGSDADKVVSSASDFFNGKDKDDSK
jgi:hypothetical protein